MVQPCTMVNEAWLYYDGCTVVRLPWFKHGTTMVFFTLFTNMDQVVPCNQCVYWVLWNSHTGEIEVKNKKLSCCKESV